MAGRPRDPYGPVDHVLEYPVKLPAPVTDKEAFILSDVAPTWCRKRMREIGNEERWSRHRQGVTGEMAYSFSSIVTAILFKMTFG